MISRREGRALTQLASGCRAKLARVSRNAESRPMSLSGVVYAMNPRVRPDISKNAIIPASGPRSARASK